MDTLPRAPFESTHIYEILCSTHRHFRSTTTMLDTVVKAAETTELPTVIWLHGHECTGCSESFIRSSSPFTSDVILNMISLEYDDTLSAASGAPLEEHLEKSSKKKLVNTSWRLKVACHLTKMVFTAL